MSQSNLINEANQSISPNVDSFIKIEPINPQNLENFLNFYMPACYSCGTIIGHLGDEYLKRVASGGNPDKIFSSLGLDNYCCRTNIANPSRIPSGLIYNNPRITSKVEHSSESTKILQDSLTINDQAKRGPIVTITKEKLSESSIEDALQVNITPQFNAGLSSTTIPSYTTLNDANEEQDTIIPENSKIDASYFSDQFNTQFGLVSKPEPKSHIPIIGESKNINMMGYQLPDSSSHTQGIRGFGIRTPGSTFTSSSITNILGSNVNNVKVDFDNDVQTIDGKGKAVYGNQTTQSMPKQSAIFKPHIEEIWNPSTNKYQIIRTYK